jgi:hypothetical protein
LLGLLFDLDDGDSMFLWNMGLCLNQMALQLRRQHSS